MPLFLGIPAWMWITGAAAGGVALGGREFGREVGERTGKFVPWIGAGMLAIMAYQATKK